MVYGRPASRTLLEGLLHPWCCLCCGADGVPGRDLCAPCAAELPALGPACARCALPVTGGALCRRCTRAPPPQSAALVPFRYAFPVDRLIVGLKFAGRLERARLLGDLLAERIGDRLQGAARPAALIAVPLHPARAQERGFNQAAEIARPFATALGLPLLEGMAARTRATAEQSTLAARARRANVRGAFAIAGTPPAHVAILDDVITTGATAAALAAALRAAGAERVTLIAVARAV